MVRVDRGALHGALKLLSRAIPPRSAMPILGTVIVYTVNRTLRLCTTDLTTRLECELPAEGDGLRVCISAKVLAALVKPESKRDAGMVSLALDGDRLLVQVDGVTTRLPVTDPAQFPLGISPDLSWSLVGMCSAAPLRDALEWTLPAACTDTTRRHICAVLLDPSGVAVSTDGHRMHTAPCPITPEAPILLPADSAEILRRVLADGEQAVMARTKIGEREVLRVRCGHWQLETSLVDATFPPHKHVIPSRDDQPTRFSVERAAFLKALRRVTAVAKNKQVRLWINGALSISSADLDGGEASVVVPVSSNTHSGDDLVIGFDGRYLLDALQGTDGAVEMGFNKSLDPLRVDLSGNRVSVIMPCRT